MATHTVRNISLKGVAACVPKERFEICDYEHFTTQEKQDFTARIGIESKRTSKGRLTSADLCYSAAEQLIADLRWSKDEIGVLIFISQTPDYLLPASSIILQNRLSLPKSVLAFDINLGCSGWGYGLATISSLMKTLSIKKGILLTGETAVLADYDNKIAFPLMGDAGTATALEIEEGSKMFFNLQSDGAGYDSIIAEMSGARFLTSGSKPEMKYQANLNGQKVWEFCLREIAPSITSLLNFSETKPEAIDYYILHQANKIVNESIRKKLAVEPGKFPYSIQHYGNTSSASIPLTMVTQIKEELRTKPLSMLCSGFGVGLSWANVILQTNKIVCSDLLEIE
jgi:3-oxoacyl-[acyl-carrier-protein] synthase III